MENYNPEHSHAELLSGIHQEIEHAQPTGNSARPFAPFGALLIKLSKEAETQAALSAQAADKNLKVSEAGLIIADKNLKMQDRVLLISAVLLILTLLQVFLSLSDFATRSNDKHKTKDANNSLQQQNGDAKTK